MIGKFTLWTTSHRRSLLLGGALYLLAVGGAAWAQSGPASTDADQIDAEAPVTTEKESLLVEAPLPFIPASNTITSKLPVDLAWTPANVGVVDKKLLDEQGAVVLGEALENVSGVNVQSGFGVFDFFVVRGFDSLTSGLVLTDGAPEPEATFYQLYNTERVELLKGPGGFLYGPNPLAGTVNIVRKQPTAGAFGSAAMRLGSFDTYEGSFDVNRTASSGEVGFRLNGLWRQSAGYRDGRESEVGAANPSFTWRPNPTTSLNLNLEFVAADYMPDAGLPLVQGQLPDVPRRRSYASPFDRSEQDIFRLQLDFERQISTRLSVRNKTYLRQLDWLSDGTLLGFVLPTPFDSLVVTRSLLLLDDRQQFLGNQLELLWSARTWGLSHRLLAGVELASFDDQFTLDVALLPPIDLFNPIETASEPLFLLQDQSSAGDSRSTIVAPYLIDQIALHPRIQLLIGARYDSIDFEDDVSGAKRTDREVSPMAGLVFQPSTDLSLYANFARSFAPPSARVSGEQKPEKSRQIELGARREMLDGRLRLTLAVYELERDNIAIPDDNGFTQQVGDQRAKGLELEAALELSEDLHGVLVYGYTESELTEFTERVLVSFQPPTLATFDRSGNRSAFSPEHLVKGWLSHRLGIGLTVAGGLRYVSAQFIAEDNVSSLDDYLLFDLALLYPSGDWRAGLHLHNLSDQEYETRGFGGASVIPGSPRSATVEIRYRF